MTIAEFDTIKQRYERLCAYVEEDPRAGSHACAISYSLDVPLLIAEVERLRRALEAA